MSQVMIVNLYIYKTENVYRRNSTTTRHKVNARHTHCSLTEQPAARRAVAVGSVGGSVLWICRTIGVVCSRHHRTSS